MAHYDIDVFLFVNCAYFMIITCIISSHLLLLPYFQFDFFLECISTKKRRLIFLSYLIALTGFCFFIFKLVFGFYELTITRLCTGMFALMALLFFPLLTLFKIDSDEKITELKLKMVNVNERHGKIDINSLIYIYSKGNYLIWVCLVEDKIVEYKVRETLKSAINRLEKNKNLKQSHRAFYLNIDYIEKIDRKENSHEISISNLDLKIPLSRTFYSDFT